MRSARPVPKVYSSPHADSIAIVNDKSAERTLALRGFLWT